MPIQYLLFDAANTLLHKPLLWERLQEVLTTGGHEIPLPQLRRNHKLLSECLPFPDRTSRQFYRTFNAELLYSLGIIPTADLLERIFQACAQLPWEAFRDTVALAALPLPLGVASNFNHSLPELLTTLFGADRFRHICVSEAVGVAKPHRAFYEAVLAQTGVPAESVLYIGDSIKLDMEPAKALGMHTALIDREQLFPHFPRRLDSLSQLAELLG
ncbi:HAD family hydrolase [Hymenobacter psychrophilus]|uniref:Haloacid dehalogenase superfamily, subfamily IA, variant 3 with third motif having DD or ED/haloacid dehalogenase superfamily, subfamily IA, variant 1 with third motif having Dx(3-4)D or Dx(3-4)E n=1 Tax=Hymenobacter psychrophilus TaxID=651662 RepID=A0A1H3EEV1_9BACT|nr:HAD family hydrolase [Hymenobacter psychrophilus]SDX76449.1 haloacid dehalogenase superfamily, subfamily IA, variant 3 with third motif having DD or ED/haloacid dehalogenase superfamily, subfamily IA, variant 1 with third motif having Dx(3-4)D or Dx(3-4)E [Hymenobacter psychrophilus]